MSYDFTGKLVEKFDTQQVSEKFKKREFVLEKDEMAGSFAFKNTVKFQLNNDRCALIDNVNMGQEIKVTFNLKGSRWEKEGKVNYFNNLEVWRIELALPDSGPASGTSFTPPIPADVDMTVPGNDDLPF